LEFTVPQALHAPLERYLRHWRPLLLAIGRRRNPDGQGQAAGERLWVTIDGTAVSAGAQQKDHVQMAAQLLGHASLQTTERYYIAANSRSALRQHHDRIREIRRGAGTGRAGRK
jgi:integrase